MAHVSSNHRPYAYAGYALLALGLGGFTVWASIAEVASAVVAPGAVAVVSNRKTIQHLEGGIVEAIEARDGTAVHEGDVLVRLDRTQAAAELEALQAQMDAGLAEQARLEAERDGLENLLFPEALRNSHRQAAISAMDIQRSLFEARKRSVASQVEMLDKRIASQRNRAEAYGRQAANISEEIDSNREELEGISTLASKGFASRTNERNVERRIMTLKTASSEAEAEIAAAESAAAEAEMEKVMAVQRLREDATTQLAKTQEENANLVERIAIARDTLARKDVKAPQDGVVQALKFHAKGAVIRAGEPILELVPVSDDLVVETQFPAVSIDQVHPGMVAEVRFPSFSSRLTPILLGKVETVSPDALPDAEGRRLSFEGRVSVLPSSIPEEMRGRLQPGMPAEIIVATEDRTVLSYLLKPLTDALARTFKER